MRFLEQNHRYFAFASVATLVIHSYLQLTYRWLSITGIITGTLLVLTVLLGVDPFVQHKGKRGLLFQAHRISALTLLCPSLCITLPAYSSSRRRVALSNHITNAFVGMVQWWISCDLSQTSKELA